MRFLFFLLSIITVNAQNRNDSINRRLLLEFTAATDFSSAITKQNGTFGFGIWYRYPMENDAILELGGNFQTGSTLYHFNYGKDGSVYQVGSKGYILNLGGRFVKNVTLKNKKVEWISELTFNTLFFDGTGIPDDPNREPTDPRTTHIVIDAEGISTLQFGQGLRVWHQNVGFGLKTNFAPYKLWYKSTVPINLMSSMWKLHFP